MIHRIHLKGPWDFRPLQSMPTANLSLPAEGTVKFPAAWQDILGDFRGSVRFTRRFNCPTNLEDDDRVHLVFDGIGGSAEVRLNQHPVGSVQLTDQSARFDVTSHLQLHNNLEITIVWEGSSPELGGLWGPVALEIVERSDRQNRFPLAGSPRGW